MAEGFCRALAGDRVECASGGSRPLGHVLPEAIEVMRERGIDISSHTSKGFDEEWVRGCDAIVTMGCGDDACPAFFGKRIVDWELEDPKGKELGTFRRVRDEIRERVCALLAGLGVATDGAD
jgi:protein-tyrosine-phosphatase